MIRGFVVFLSMILVLSCQKTKAPVVIPITPLQTLVNSDTSLSLFHRMLLQANDAGLLADKSVTILIPTNAALRQAGFSETIIDSSGASEIDRILRFQYLPTATTVDSGGYLAYPTLLNLTIHGMRDSAQHSFFNGAQTSGDPTQVGKALVYRLTGTIPIARDSLVELLDRDTTLSFLAELFLRTNLYDSLLMSGQFTLLAPVNDAFRQAGYDSIGVIDSADINVLIQLARNQVLNGLFFTNTFPAAGSLPSLGGGSVTINATGGGWQFAGTGNVIPANWLNGNQQAGNSLIVHRIDQLISN